MVVVVVLDILPLDIYIVPLFFLRRQRQPGATKTILKSPLLPMTVLPWKQQHSSTFCLNVETVPLLPFMRRQFKYRTTDQPKGIHIIVALSLAVAVSGRKEFLDSPKAKMSMACTKRKMERGFMHLMRCNVLFYINRKPQHF